MWQNFDGQLNLYKLVPHNPQRKVGPTELTQHNCVINCLTGDIKAMA